MKKLVVICFALMILHSAAFANSILFWDFENPNVLTALFAETSYNVAVAGTAFNTDFQWETFFGDTFLMTPYFGTYRPEITFTTTVLLDVSDLSFEHIHNHTAGYPTDSSYATQLQLDRNDGNGFADIGGLLPPQPHQ
jgi:hypothetical protein